VPSGAGQLQRWNVLRMRDPGMLHWRVPDLPRQWPRPEFLRLCLARNPQPDAGSGGVRFADRRQWCVHPNLHLLRPVFRRQKPGSGRLRLFFWQVLLLVVLRPGLGHRANRHRFRLPGSMPWSQRPFVELTSAHDRRQRPRDGLPRRTAPAGPRPQRELSEEAPFWPVRLRRIRNVIQPSARLRLSGRGGKVSLLGAFQLRKA
jgi:hypothetical protein